VHADAAWGGYLTTIFRRPDGGFRDRDELRAEYKYFPSELVYESFKALGECDSITVDPHKLGYVPYAAGAFLCRNRDVVDFLTQRAAYVFDLGDSDEQVAPGDKLRNLGQYILEGSKSGAAAAAVYVTHRVLPLDCEGFGRLLSHTVHTSEDFFDKAREVAAEMRDRVRILVPFEPDSNVICLGLNPADNRDLARMNRFARSVFASMKVDAAQPLQVKSFIGSYTSLLKESAPREQSLRILEGLGLDPATFRSLPEDADREADHIFLLRHTLMNPWLAKKQDGASYIDRYWAYLVELLEAALAEDRRL
jgi:glutamate/tyrosine decarboxylase-like PLP-dependent enzyme